MLTLEDLMEMNSARLQEVMNNGQPLALDAMANTQYLGVDLSLPSWVGKILWKTFRKTFYADPALGGLRGWNVRMEQHGVHGPAIPMTDRKGQPMTFGHYRVCEVGDQIFPKGWRGRHFLDYTAAGNAIVDPAGLGFTPLVSVNGGPELLLGWEVFKLGPLKLPFPLYWALQLQGPIEGVVDPPRLAPQSPLAQLSKPAAYKARSHWSARRTSAMGESLPNS